mgnify:CR=1 FL=1
MRASDLRAALAWQRRVTDFSDTPLAEVVARQIAYPVVTPNFLTVVGFFLTCGVALVIGMGIVLLVRRWRILR